MNDERGTVKVVKPVSTYEILLPEPDPLQERKLARHKGHERTSILYGEGIYTALVNNIRGRV